MPKKLFRKITPSPEFVRDHKSLSAIAHLLADPNLFHLNRHSVSRAFAVGMGVAMLPIYGHMLIAAILAIWCRANLTISVILVWISNPLTFPVMLVVEYWIGASLLGIDGSLAVRDINLSEWRTLLSEIWKPLIVGGVALSLASSIVSYTLVMSFWRWYTQRRWYKRGKNTYKN